MNRCSFSPWPPSLRLPWFMPISPTPREWAAAAASACSAASRHPRRGPRRPPATFSGPAANPVMPARPGATAAIPHAAPLRRQRRRSIALVPLARTDRRPRAGLGLAALFSHLGLSEGLGSLLLIGFLLVGAMALFRAFARAPQRRRWRPSTRGAGRQTRARSPLATAREPAIEPAWGSPASAPAPARAVIRRLRPGAVCRTGEAAVPPAAGGLRPRRSRAARRRDDAGDARGNHARPRRARHARSRRKS